MISWDSINYYWGLSAGTLAGEMLYVFTPEYVGWTWMGWLRWIGIGIAMYGAGSMATQVISWGGDLIDAVNSIEKVKTWSEFDGEWTSYASTIEGMQEKLASIAAATSVPVAFALVTMPGFRETLFNGLKYAYNNYMQPVVTWYNKHLKWIFDTFDFQGGAKVSFTFPF